MRTTTTTAAPPAEDEPSTPRNQPIPIRSLAEIMREHRQRPVTITPRLSPRPLNAQTELVVYNFSDVVAHEAWALFDEYKATVKYAFTAWAAIDRYLYEGDGTCVWDPFLTERHGNPLRIELKTTRIPVHEHLIHGVQDPAPRSRLHQVKTLWKESDMELDLLSYPDRRVRWWYEQETLMTPAVMPRLRRLERFFSDVLCMQNRPETHYSHIDALQDCPWAGDTTVWIRTKSNQIVMPNRATRSIHAVLNDAVLQQIGDSWNDVLARQNMLGKMPLPFVLVERQRTALD